MKVLKVLFVWDQGINYLLKRGLESLGVEVRGITHRDFDPFGYTPKEWKVSYGGRFYHQRLLFDIVKRARGCDVVHIHSLEKVVPILKLLGFKVVLHYHGSEIRGRWDDKRRYWREADAVLVSTRDLLMGAPKIVRHQPNPIDVNVFKPMGVKKWGALHFDYDAADIAELIAERNFIPLIVKKKGVPYADMPAVLNEYTHYIDVKRDYSDKILTSRATDTGSLIALQALACGATVLTLLGRRVGLPPEHRPDEVAKSVLKVYKEVAG